MKLCSLRKMYFSLMLNQFSYKERYEFQNLLQETVRFPRCKSYLTQRQIFQCKTTTTKNKKKIQETQLHG